MMNSTVLRLWQWTAATWMLVVLVEAAVGQAPAVPGAIPPQAVASADCPAACCERPCTCPDDYCAKPMPPLAPRPCKWLCDDYCAKPLPAPPVLQCKWCCDDYCAKPLTQPGALCQPWYVCVSQQEPGLLAEESAESMPAPVINPLAPPTQSPQAQAGLLRHVWRASTARR